MRRHMTRHLAQRIIRHAGFTRISSLAATFAAGLAMLATAPAATAQTYPAHSVKIIVPFPAGGSADAMPRLIGDWLSRKWGQPVVIENRPGAAGNIGTGEAFRATPDGYTLLSSPPPPLVINQNLYAKLPFDPAKFEPIILISRVPNSLMANATNVKANTVAEFIASAKANPGKITSAIQGNGTTSHLTSELFESMAGVKLQHIPYTGSAPALNDLLGGTTDVMFDNLGVSLPLVKAGKLKLIAVASPKRLADLPDVPTIAETLPGFDSSAWYAIMAPPGTPKAITDKINADVNEALRDPVILDKLKNFSAEPIGGTTVETAKIMQEDVARWKKVLDDAKVPKI
jgi:tripartite-type tricarboxylate transporter receptor subunit TctC